MRIGVLSGGRSAEREISIKTGNAVAGSLKGSGYNVITFDLDENFAENLKNIDVCFIALHGTYGEDGKVQGALDIFGIPYTGSGVMASALAMDKIKSKALFNYYGLKTPQGITVKIGEKRDAIRKKLMHIEPPYFIKPNASGSSIGCGIVNGEEELADALNNAFKYDDEV
ncbi:MAG: D-alanine--D-alanine ligase, partial [Deltaproteobacteria bacterium]|nr:D-alanine--D-alanine ligase [Deltaproteobacteria bacterium]